MSENSDKKLEEKPNKKIVKKKKGLLSWIVFSTILTFFLSFAINFVAEILVKDMFVGFAMVILLIIVLIGIVSDMIGVAVTSADEVPFHSMAARKVYGSKAAINLVRNADKVGNIANDVIGDICSVVSGATSAVIVGKLILQVSFDPFYTGLVFTAIVAALMVGGKAAGKFIAIKQSQNVVFIVAKILAFFGYGGKNNGRKKSKHTK